MITKLRLIIAGIALLILIMLLLRGCRSSDSTNPDQGFEPRPDVLAWIDKHYGHDPRKKATMMRLAEAGQYILTHENSGSAEEETLSIGMGCFFIAFKNDRTEIDGMPPYEALAAQTYNTSARARKRIAYLGRLKGKVFKMPIVTSWEDQCEKPLRL